MGLSSVSAAGEVADAFDLFVRSLQGSVCAVCPIHEIAAIPRERREITGSRNGQLSFLWSNLALA